MIGDGTISFEEFTEMMCCLRQRQSPFEQFRETFNIFDINGDGVIDKWELKATMASLGEEVTEDDVTCMFMEVDADNDGRIDLKGQNGLIIFYIPASYECTSI